MPCAPRRDSHVSREDNQCSGSPAVRPVSTSVGGGTVCGYEGFTVTLGRSKLTPIGRLAFPEAGAKSDTEVQPTVARAKLCFRAANRSGRLAELAGGSYACPYRFTTGRGDSGSCWADGPGASRTAESPGATEKSAAGPSGGWRRQRNAGKHRDSAEAAGALHADARREWIRTLSDGGTITFVNKRRIARDAKGRIYQERWALVPKNGKAESMMTAIQIADPNAHTLYNCFPLAQTKHCDLIMYTASSSTDYTVASPATGPLPGDRGFAVHEDLGKQFIAGVETVGTRDATTYNPGLFGNDRKVTIEREFWHSPQLGVNLLSIRSDPRIGKQTFTVRTVILGEPDLSLFELPAGFTVVDRRQSAPP